MKIISPSKGDQEATQDQAERAEKASSDMWMVTLTLCLVVVGFLQFVIFVIQASVFWIQADRLRQTIITMEGTAERQLRAYISAESRSLLNFDTQAPIRVVVALQNAGQTPAHEMRFAGGVHILEHPYEKGTVFNVSFEGDISKTVLHPGKEFMAQAVATETVPAEALAAIRTGTSWRLYVGGVVQYKDAFGKCRSTKFLASAGGRDFAEAMDTARGDLSQARINWQHAPEHNEAN